MPLPEVSANCIQTRGLRMDKSGAVVLSAEEEVDTAGGAGNNKSLQLLLSKVSVYQ